MVSEGYKSVVNIDYSETAILHMNKFNKRKELSYKLMDVCNMSDFEDCSFHSLLDKGTFDAIMCSSGSPTRVE